MNDEPVLGPVADEVRAELPDLRLWSLAVDAVPGRSDPGLRARLRGLSDRFYGARAIAMRRDPVPQAYRVLFRHVGLDPDADRTPIEAAVLERLVRGGFASAGRIPDALTIGLVETGVPVWALDRDRVAGALGVRLARPGEGVPAGRIVVADERGPVAELFGEPREDRAVTPTTTALVLFTLQPAGVPAIHVEEALWLVCDALAPETQEPSH